MANDAGCINIRKRNLDYQWSVIKEVVIPGSEVEDLSGPAITVNTGVNADVLFSDHENNVYRLPISDIKYPPEIIHENGKHPNAIEHNERTYMYTDVAGTPYEIQIHTPGSSSRFSKGRENTPLNTRYYRRISLHNRKDNFHASLTFSEVSINSGNSRVSFTNLPPLFPSGDTLYASLNHTLNTGSFFTADSISKLSFDLNLRLRNVPVLSKAIELKVNLVDATSHQILATMFAKNILGDSTVSQGIEFILPAHLKNKMVYVRPLLSGTIKNNLTQMRARVTEVYILLPGTEQITLNKNAVSASNSLLPDKFMLNQNYPNPFNPTTNISFSLPLDAQVKLTIFDITGRKVKTLSAQNFAKGRHTITWDSTNDRGIKTASGIYIYRLTASLPGHNKILYQDTRKMVLLR